MDSSIVMLVRTARHPDPVADDHAPPLLETPDAGVSHGTATTGYDVRCSDCHRLQRVPKPVLRGWHCAACAQAAPKIDATALPRP